MLVVAAFALAGCSTDSPETPSDEASAVESETSSGPEAAETSSTLVPLITAPPTTNTDQTEDSAEPLTEGETVEQVWIEFITAAAGQSSREQIAALATDEARASAAAVFTEPRIPQAFSTEIDLAPDGNSARMTDCSLFSFPLVEFPYIPITGQATKIDNTWQITEFDVRPTERCIPVSLATEVFAAYERFWDNELLYSDPPDPNHRLIERTLTGRRLQRKRGVLEWQVENNAALRGRPTTNPGFSDLQPGLVILVDCQIPDPESGLYDLTTGDRRPETEPPSVDQTDLVRTWLELEGGAWKVEFSGVETDTGCDPQAPPDTIPVVGPTEP